MVYELTGSEKQPTPGQSNGNVNASSAGVATSAPSPVTSVVTQEEKSWLDAELAVGYDFLNIHAKTSNGANFEMLGSIQTLPSISLYLSHQFSGRAEGYFGVGTGFVVLRNVRAYDRSGKIYAIAGDTWGLTPSIGGIYRLQEEGPSHLGLSVFVEGSYEVRNFTSLAYTLPTGESTLPSGLPRGLNGSGFVLNLGLEIKFRKKPPAPSGKP